MTPFDGVGLWIWPKFWGGNDLTEADAAAYKAAGVRWVAIKSSDGTEGNPEYPAQQQLASQAGLLVFPWAYIEPTPVGTEAAQVKVAWEAAGSPASGFTMWTDIEAAINVGAFGRAMASYGLRFGVTTWGNPSPAHNGAPSVGQLADVGCLAFGPQSYYSAWGVSAQAAIQTSVSNFGGLGLGPYTKPLLPLVDGPAILAAAQACKAAGLNGISAWRYGANGITPTSFAGVADVFGTVAPSPVYLTLAAPTVVSQLSSPTDPWDACGEACVASVLTDAGSPETAGYVVQQALADGYAQTGGTTTGANLVALLAHFGVAAHEVTAPLYETIPEALSRKHEVIVLVSSNSDGVPTAGTGIGHWLLAWGQDPQGDKVMNPLNNPAGQLDLYSFADLNACDLKDAVEIDRVLVKDNGTPLSSPSLSPGTYTLPSGTSLTVT